MTVIRRAILRCVPVAGVIACLAVSLGAGTKAARRPAREAVTAGLPEAVRQPPSAPAMELPPVDRSARPAVREAAGRINALLERHWEEHAVTPSRPLSDDEFLRRTYLELAGRIPSYDEVVAFRRSKAADRRESLVDDLLESPDYVSHLYNFWADILRLQERPGNHLYLDPFLHYVKDSIRTNKPYDAWVHEMLTADGKPWENPAVGFQLRDEGMPLPYVDNTVRVLLGTQIGCAQCHDHPFDHWTQREFYELAALTAGTRSRPGGGGGGKGGGKTGERHDPVALAAVRLQKQNRARKSRKLGVTTQYIRASVTSVAFAERPLLLPHDYAYDDAEPLSLVDPAVLWGEVPASARDSDRREQFAAWIVARDNRQFARTIANRLWKKVMGVGLVEPVDDFRDENPPSHPELLELLTDEMLRLDFDLREFLRLLVSTDAYQRRAVPHDAASGMPFRFAGPALRRMTAEQLWDSILTLVARNPWTVQRPTPAEIAAPMQLDVETATLEDVDRSVAAFQAQFGRNQYLRRIDAICGYRGLELVKASELPSPLPLGHFLRQFGQSDREMIEGSRKVATIPQILAMFNGPITHSMLEKGSVIYDNVASQPPNRAVDVVFLSLLTHAPSAEDRRLAIREITSAEDPAIGCGNLIWALLNTREFIFVQ
ncbi:MAG: DUF1549 and DUF1553 domain-containing protein [Planctomycetota bacterium]